MMLREFLILILILAIIVVLLRGIYVAMRRRKNKIKFQLEKNIPEYDLEELELRELPSGGARVVERSFAEVMRQHGLPNDRIPAARGPGSLSSPTKTFPKKTTDTFARAKGQLNKDASKEGTWKSAAPAAAAAAASTVASQVSASPAPVTEPEQVEETQQRWDEPDQGHAEVVVEEQTTDSSVDDIEHAEGDETNAELGGDAHTDMEWGAAVDRASAQSYDDDEDWLDDVSPVREVKVAADRHSDGSASRSEPTFDASASEDWDAEFAPIQEEAQAADPEPQSEQEPEPETDLEYGFKADSEAPIDPESEPEATSEDNDDADSDAEFEFVSATSFGAQRGADDEVSMDEDHAEFEADELDEQEWQEPELEEHEYGFDDRDFEEQGVEEQDWSESNLYESAADDLDDMDETDNAVAGNDADDAAEESHLIDAGTSSQRPRTEPENIDDVLDELLEQSGVSVHAVAEPEPEPEPEVDVVEEEDDMPKDFDSEYEADPEPQPTDDDTFAAMNPEDDIDILFDDEDNARRLEALEEKEEPASRRFFGWAGDTFRNLTAGVAASRARAAANAEAKAEAERQVKAERTRQLQQAREEEEQAQVAEQLRRREEADRRAAAELARQQEQGYAQDPLESEEAHDALYEDAFYEQEPAQQDDYAEQSLYANDEREDDAADYAAHSQQQAPQPARPAAEPRNAGKRSGKENQLAFDISSDEDDQDDPGYSEVLVINVMARPGTEIAGDELLQVLLGAGLRFGNMSIFHRHADRRGGPVLFSVANALNPGTFDLNEIHEFTTKGVCFFMTLPNVANNMLAFEQMLATAKHVQSTLDADLKDDNRSVMTAQTIEHYRQRIRDFELQQLKHGKR